MDSCEIVRRTIEFGDPPRVPFFQHEIEDLPDDICDCWEMDRAKNGWFFDNPAEDDWGCGWLASEVPNMGQVVHHPVASWDRLDRFIPPDPKDSFYYERLEQEMAAASDRYVVILCHFNLIDRLFMLHEPSRTLMDFYLEPERIEKLLDMILEFKLNMFRELQRRFGGRVHALFLTDDWGTQDNTFIGADLFEFFFLERYRQMVQEVHRNGWHFWLHSCGRINNFIPHFLDVGVDVLNMQQPLVNGIREIGESFAGKVCFLATADIQHTLTSNDPLRIRGEVQQLMSSWATTSGGVIAFRYNEPQSLGVSSDMTEVMLREFAEGSPYGSR